MAMQNQPEQFVWADVLPRFRPQEVFSPDTDGAVHLLDVPFWSAVSEFREQLGRSLLINHGPHTRRGVRSPREQLELQRHTKRAAELSLHVAGKAADLSCPGLSVDELAQAAIAFGFPGVGIYSTFVHVDWRTLAQPGQVVFRRK